MLFVYTSDLPEIRALEDYRPDTVTELYADDGQSIGTFALQRRILLTYEQIPKVLKDAILSTEDQHFEEHWGVDFTRVVGAAWRDIAKRRIAEGASTITMQLAGGLFLDRSNRSFRRKIAGNAAGPSNRAPLHQAADPHDVLQSDLSWPRQLRIRSGVGILFRQAGRQADAAGSGVARGNHSRARRIRRFLHAQRARARRNLVLSLMAHERQNYFR